MGAVQGALVFADHFSSGSLEANRRMDADEAAFSSTTDANGNFTIPATPAYKYLIMTLGGIDSITGQPAMEMVALTGARNVSPLTTMVALNSATRVTIESLGIAYDGNLAVRVTPAAALFVQSVQTAVAALTQALNPGGNSLPVEQQNNIQLWILNYISSSIESKSVTDLTTPTTLTTLLTTALQNSLSRFNFDYQSITTSTAGIKVSNANTIASDIANQAVTSAVTAITTSWPGVDLSNTTTIFTEAALVNAAGAATINLAIQTAVTNAGSQILVTPPAFPIPVITGAPATRIAVGKTYSFVPKASDSNGNLLIFSIVNKPAWASFNPGTGALTGTPVSTDVGTTTNILITVSNGVQSASLPAFSLEVYTPSGSPGGTGNF